MKRIFTIALAAMTLAGAYAQPQTSLQSKGKEMRKTSAMRGAARSQGAGYMKAAPETDLSKLPLVTDPGDAEEKEYSRDSYYYYIEYTGERVFMQDMGLVSEVAYGKDGKVYFKNPFGGRDTDTYLVGTRDGDKISVELPQKIFVEEYEMWDENGPYMQTDTYYAFKLKYTTDGTTSKMEIDTNSQTVDFTVTEHGLVMDSNDGASYIGMLLALPAEDGSEGVPLLWSGMADTGIVFNEVTATKVEAPENLEVQEWVLTEDGSSRLLKGGFDGDDFYLQGLLGSEEDLWVKGEVKDGKMTFPSGQYMGICNRYDHYAYLIPAEYEKKETAEGTELFYYPDAAMYMDYDAGTKTLTSCKGGALAISTIPQEVFYIEAYAEPKFAWQDSSVPMTPANPQVTDFSDYFEEMGFSGLTYEIPTVSTDGRLLNLDRYYYNIMIDGEPLTLYPDEYTDLEEEMTDIPYGYEDSNIYFWGDIYEAMIFVTGFQKIGIRSIYVNANGEKTYSQPSYWDVTSSVDAAEALGKDVEKVEYYDLSGRKSDRPVSGISVRRTIYKDGSVRNDKIVRK